MKQLAIAISNVLKPKTRLNAHEWSSKNLRLEQRSSARPGFFDVSFTPYLKQVYEWFSDPRVQELTGAKSRQVGGTTLLVNALAYSVAEDPGPSLFVTSNINTAQSFSEQQWRRRVELCPALRDLKPEDSDEYRKLEMNFKTCTVKFVGSNSSSNLMSRAVRYLFCDEVDEWPAADSEVAAIDIVTECTLSYAHRRKILRISTPTLVEGTIWKYFLRGSQHKYKVPCPHCNTRFELLFQQLNFHRDQCRSESGIWDLDKLANLTSLTCLKCKKNIPQSAKLKMVEKGEWTQTNPHAPRNHISWHISALYSPFKSWGQCAVEFIQCCGTAGGLRSFYNHVLGLPFVPKQSSINISDVEKVQAQSPKYRLYDGPNWISPAEFKHVVMAVDVQQDGFWWVQRGICEDQSSYLIDYGPAASWTDLTELAARKFQLPSGIERNVYKAVIDCGYIAKREYGVFDFCYLSNGKFIPIQGRAAAHGMIGDPVRSHTFDHKGSFIDGLQLRDDLFKESLYIYAIKERVKKWYLPENLDDVYKRQLTDEKQVVKKTNRGEVMEWKDFGNNHLGDCEKYCLGALDLLVPILHVDFDGHGVGQAVAPSAATTPAIEPSTEPYIPKTPQESVRLRNINLE